MVPDYEMIRTGWNCLCPSCRKSSIYKPGFSLNLKDRCESCGFDIAKNDSGDGPAVFLIFILGFALVPLALMVDAWFHWPMLVHIVVWSVLAIGLTLGTLRPLKAYIIALQYKHRRSDWED